LTQVVNKAFNVLVLRFVQFHDLIAVIRHGTKLPDEDFLKYASNRPDGGLAGAPDARSLAVYGHPRLAGEANEAIHPPRADAVGGGGGHAAAGLHRTV